MADYLRPCVAPLEFRDSDGTIIDYGHRWERAGGPPDDSYSVVEHPERFAPLHLVAEALIEHLTTHFTVRIEEGLPVIAGLQHAPSAAEIARAVRITPQGPGSAPMVFVLTTFPGVWLHAGALFSAVFPSCGCIACDEHWDTAADELEALVFTVLGGGFGEEISRPQRAKWSYDRGRGLVKGMGQTVSYRLRSPDGRSGSSGQRRAKDVPPELLSRAQTRLSEVAQLSPDGNWLPWQRSTPPTPA